jgi:rhodanese-related sulfurtransferase
MSRSISPQELDSLRRGGQAVELIDVRTPVEFREIHVEYARNVPLDRLDPAAVRAERQGSPDAPLYVICKSGSRGRQACEKLTSAGIASVVNVDGGTLACEAAGLPVVRGKKAVSLERQVRIAAGALVLTGAALGYFVHPYWIGLSAFVGAGLMFAGITDTCGMAMMLARMPWNRVAGGSGGVAGNASCRVAALFLVATGLAVGLPRSVVAIDHTTDTLPQVKAAFEAKKAVLIDVRETSEWKAGHVRGAQSLPLSALQKGVAAADLDRVLPKDRIVYLHCQAGRRCLMAAEILAKKGYQVRPLKPGFPALRDAGFPVAEGE